MWTDSWSASAPASSQAVEQGAQRAGVAVAGHLQGERARRRWCGRAGAGAQGLAAVSRAAGSAKLQQYVAAGDAPLELVGRALGRDPAVVQQRDPVGELVGLLQVLGGEEDRDAAGHQVADDLPHGAPAARVQPGGRLVQEDQPRVARPASWPGRGGAACRRSRWTPACGAASARSNRSSSSAARSPAPGAAQVVQVRHQPQVLLAGEQLVDGGELAGDADRGPDRVRLARPGRGRPPGSRPASARDQGGQDLDGGGLAGPVRAEQGEDRCLRARPGRCRPARACRRRTSAGRSR